MKHFRLAMIVIGILGLAMQSASGQIMVHSGDPQPLAPPPAAPAQAPDAGPGKVAADASNGFAFDLFARFSTRETEKTNLFFSPYSITSALTMTYLGARGKTADEMRATLHVPVPVDQLSQVGHPSDLNAPIKDGYAALNQSLVGNGKDQPFSLSVANALWGQKGEPFLPEYLQVVKQDFGGNLTPMDFITQPEACRGQINDWVAQQTNDKIKDLLPPGSITQDCRLVLTNAIYFKGEWSNPFKKEATKTGKFNSGDDQVSVDFMHQTESLAYAEDDLCQAVKLPYKGDRLSMLILLPKVRAVDAVEKGFGAEILGLEKLQASLNPSYINQLVGQLAERQVNLSIPKWQATQMMELTSVLQEMGMKLAFTQHADFSGINGRTDLSISQVIHKAYVKVDEKGTEAAAATAVVMRGSAMRMTAPPVTFTADRPFVYLITDNQSGAVLFAGRLWDPTH